MDSAVLLLVIASLYSSVHSQLCTVPNGKPKCVCETAQGTIDLTSVAEKTLSADNSKYTYFLKPCYGFSYGDGDCKASNTAVCQHNNENDNNFNCGVIDQEQIYIDSNAIYLQYGDGNDGRISIITLICDRSANTPILKAHGDADHPKDYYFDLHTKCACYDGCKYTAPKKSSKGSSEDDSGPIGIALILLCFVALDTYFIAGALIMKFKFQKTGLEIIPHREFWFLLPFLVKDGFIFTFGPIIDFIRSKGKGENYDKL